VTVITIVDGYNLLFARVRGAMAPGAAERLRAELVRLLNRYAASSGSGVIVVFDASSNVGMPQRQRHGLVSIVYARQPGKADAEILRIVRAHHNPAELRVVTSDNGVVRSCEHARAQTMSSQHFLDLLGETLDLPAQHNRPLDEPDQKYQPPGPEEVQYWLKQFSKNDRKKGDNE